MASKRKLKSKISSLKHELRKLETDMRLLRSDWLVDIERLSYDLCFAQDQVRSLMRDNRVLGDQIRDITNGEETVSVVLPIGTTLEDEVVKEAETETEVGTEQPEYCQFG